MNDVVSKAELKAAFRQIAEYVSEGDISSPAEFDTEFRARLHSFMNTLLYEDYTVEEALGTSIGKTA